MNSPLTGPVSQALERDVSAEVRRNGIVVWLDKDAAYSGFVDQLALRSQRREIPYTVVPFRGSFLELLLELEPHGSGLDRAPLLIHMPGFNEETIRATPVLELYDAGVRYRKLLDTLIREASIGRVAPAEVDAFLAKKPSLELADQWLATAASGDPNDLLRFLEDAGPQLLVVALGGDPSVLRVRLELPERVALFRNYLHRLLGLDDAWIAHTLRGKTDPTFDDVLGAVASWLLIVEYVHDLKRPPYVDALARLRDLDKELVKVCRTIVEDLRARFGDAYVRLADEIELSIGEELRRMKPDDLGRIDTFREEENRVLQGAVEALTRGDWHKAKEWCAARDGDRSFWLRRDQTRRWAWNLVGEAATFGAVLGEEPRPLAGARSVDEAVELYAARAQLVDRAHRQFEQRRLALLEPRLPHYGALQEVVGALRRNYRAWADTLARDFTALCRESGFLPSDTLQQRMLFEQVVVPMTSAGEKVAVFVVDALRFEMAAELAEELKGHGTVVDLKPRLAELPTITSVGMNALAPVAKNGRLQVAGELQGFKTGEYTVRKPEDRARAMGQRTIGRAGVLLSLAEVGETGTKELKQKLAPQSLIIVHSTEIDDAGEANVGLPTFDVTLRQIKAAWHHLQLAGVKHFVFTADHGFLFQDETTTFRSFGTKRDPGRRHVLDPHPREEAGMVPVSLASLRYDGLEGFLLFAEDTASFATGRAGATFVHGGNSLQERVIPVLTVTRPRAAGRSAAEYVLEAEAKADVLGLHRLRVRVTFAEGNLGFAAPSRVAVALRADQRSDVTTVLRDATGPGTLANGRLLLPVDAEWTEVFFALEGPKDERVRVEVFHPDQAESVRKTTPDSWFSVAARMTPTPAPAEPRDTPLTWADAIEHEGFRAIFLHIEKHGAMTEPEVTKLLGSPRAFRKFSLEFDQLLGKLPFKVRVEPGDGGKRYVRDGGNAP